MIYYLPIAVIVISNIFYHICSKSMPQALDPFAALTVTYGVGAVTSGVLYGVLNRGASLISAYKELNWSVWVLGIAIVGLEAGCIYMYKVGWEVSVGQLTHSTILSICLILIGALLYKEQITPSKIFGAVICLIGLYFINR